MTERTPSLPAKTVPTKIAWLKVSEQFPVDMRIPTLKIKTLLESNPLKSRISARRLAVEYYLQALRVTDRSRRKLDAETRRRSRTGVCEKSTPPEKKTCGKLSLENTESGAGEQFLPRDCLAKARATGVFCSQTPVAGGACAVSGLPQEPTAAHPASAARPTIAACPAIRRAAYARPGGVGQVLSECAILGIMEMCGTLEYPIAIVTRTPFLGGHICTS